jgi:DNA repair protein RadC
LLSTYHGLRGIFRQSPSNLMRVKGLGMAKIARLIASVELARRCMNEERVGADYFDPKRDLLDAIKSCISEEDRETARKLTVTCRSVDIEPIDHLI